MVERIAFSKLALALLVCLTLAAPALAGEEAVTRWQAPAADGDVRMTLPPLAPGRHTLHFGKRFSVDPRLEGLTFTLDVAAAPKSDDGDSDSESDSDSDQLGNVEIIESLYTAFATGDLDTILAIIDEDVVWIESEGIPYGGTFIGRDAVFEGVFAKIAAEWDDFTATVDDMFAADGDRVVVLQRDGGTFKATGRSMEAPAVSIWTLSDEGRVIQFLQVIDTLEVVSATLP